jgi:hypothetical protein
MSDFSRAIFAPALMAVCLALPLAAQTPAPADPAQDAVTLSFFRRVEISGFVDGYYQWNFNHPVTRTDGPERLFDTRVNSFSLNLTELSVEKKPTADSRGGFRLDLDFGPAAARIKSSEPGGIQVFQNIGQAYVSYLAPVVKGLQVDIGEFASPSGTKFTRRRTTGTIRDRCCSHWPSRSTTWVFARLIRSMTKSALDYTLSTAGTISSITT